MDKENKDNRCRNCHIQPPPLHSSPNCLSLSHIKLRSTFRISRRTRSQCNQQGMCIEAGHRGCTCQKTIKVDGLFRFGRLTFHPGHLVLAKFSDQPIICQDMVYFLYAYTLLGSARTIFRSQRRGTRNNGPFTVNTAQPHTSCSIRVQSQQNFSGHMHSSIEFNDGLSLFTPRYWFLKITTKPPSYPLIHAVLVRERAPLTSPDLLSAIFFSFL